MLKASLKSLILAAAVAFLTIPASPDVARADPDGLEGSWSGGGPVTFASGSKERAKCRAVISSSGPKSYRVNGTCATQSGKVTQTAEVFQLTSNRYRGNFHNPEFDVNGTISIIVSGRRMTATLTSTSGTGTLSFSH
jgi:hypothetical protein